MINEEPELLPCPFCGGAATRLKGRYDFGGEWFETGCDNVGCRVLPSIKTLSRDHADSSWNTRADYALALVAAERDRLPSAAERCRVCEKFVLGCDDDEKSEADQG